MSATDPKYDSRPSRDQALEVLRSIWGHDEFRTGQWTAIDAILNGEDVLAVLPTGAGKSVCYQLPASMTDGLTLVVSPLIALMRDQVDSLGRRGIVATSLDSSLTTREADQRLTDCQYGRYRLLYVSPERLRSRAFRERMRSLPIRRVAVDEAHCISEWGHDFRPAYREIADAVAHIGRPPVVALTATATPTVRDDIEKSLALSSPRRVVGSFDRPNIHWSVFKNENKRNRVATILKSIEGPAIVYTNTRRDSEQWATWLRSTGWTAGAYHAGLDRPARDACQSSWMDGSTRVVVATSAFGMGIDKPDVAVVIHVGLSAGLESYYQEAGRAGRDGRAAHAILLFNDGDERVQQGLIRHSFPERKDTQRIFETLCSVAGIAIGSEGDGPFPAAIQTVAEALSVDSGNVVGVVRYLERQGIVSMLDDGANDGYLRLRDLSALRRYASSDAGGRASKVATGLLRKQRLLDDRTRWDAVRYEALAGLAGVDESDVAAALNYLASAGAIELKPGGHFMVALNVARPRQLDLDHGQLRRSRKAAKARLREILAYVDSRTCRRERILVYFGETASGDCRRCDVCRDRSRTLPDTAERKRIAAEVIGLVSSGRPKSEWPTVAGYDERSIDDCLDALIRDGVVRVSPRLDGSFELISGRPVPDH